MASDLPPVPAAPTAPPAAAAPRTIIFPIVRVGPAQAAAANAGVKTAFDEAPAATAAARQKASAFRQAAAGALRQLLAVRVQALTLAEEAKADAALTEALAGEGISSKRLAELLKLAGPLLDAFTTAPTPPPPAAS